MHFIRTTGLAVALLPLALMTANAGVIIGGTRVIFEGAKKEATINITKPDNTPYLIQSWIDMQDGVSGNAPFIITPPLYRLDGGQKNLERIVMTGSLPQEQESLFCSSNIPLICFVRSIFLSFASSLKADFLL